MDTWVILDLTEEAMRNREYAYVMKKEDKLPLLRNPSKIAWYYPEKCKS